MSYIFTRTKKKGGKVLIVQNKQINLQQKRKDKEIN